MGAFKLAYQYPDGAIRIAEEFDTVDELIVAVEQYRDQEAAKEEEADDSE